MNHCLHVAVLLLLLVAHAAAADVVEYHLGDTIQVPCGLNEPGRIEHMRSVVLLGVSKASIKGTWSSDDCQVLLNGNVVRIALFHPVPVPIGILADNGVFYQLQVTPTSGGEAANSVLTVIPAPQASDALGNAGADPDEVNGGHWESEVNLVLKLQKHIRGGRLLSAVTGVPKYNQQILRQEGRRVPGAIWHSSDDWRVLEYYEWTLQTVHAHYIGVTYQGRDASQDFNYQQQKTDNTLAIWHQDRAGDRQFYTRKLPRVRLERGREEMFIIYTIDPPQAP